MNLSETERNKYNFENIKLCAKNIWNNVLSLLFFSQVPFHLEDQINTELNQQITIWGCANRKWNYFSHFQASAEKTSFTKCFSFYPRVSKLSCNTGNEILQTIISSNYRPLIKMCLICTSYIPLDSSWGDHMQLF